MRKKIKLGVNHRVAITKRGQRKRVYVKEGTSQRVDQRHLPRFRGLESSPMESCSLCVKEPPRYLLAWCRTAPVPGTHCARNVLSMVHCTTATSVLPGCTMV